MATKVLDTKIDISGVQKMAKQVANAAKTTDNMISLAIKKSAILIDAKSKEKIQKGTPTGRTYKRRSVTHRASSPGDSPVTDTGRLVSSIRFVMPGRMSAEVGSLANIAKYGNMLEEGTSRMAARPWLEPTLKENAGQISNLITAAIKHGGLAT